MDCKLKLRFPEFNEEWEETPLNQLLSFKNGLNASKEKYGKGTKFINVSDILNNDFLTYDNVEGSVEVSKEQFKNYLVTYGDVLFQRSSETREEVGTSNVYLDPEKNCVFGGFVIRGKRIAEYEPFFLKELLTTSSVRKEITSRSGGSTRYNIGQESLKMVNIKIPSILEQKKIASFLSKVDEKIEKLEKKQELWETYKKGIMQQIFSQKLRFKDENGEDYPDWEDKKLREIIENIIDNRGKTPPISQTGIPLIEVSSVGSMNVDYTKIGKYVSEEIYNKWFRKHLKEGDLLFSTVGRTGLCSLYKDNPKAAVAQNIIGMRFKNVNQFFMFYLLTETRNNHYIKSIEMSAVQPSIKVTQLTELDFKIPTIPEQQKIAAILSAIDQKIEIINMEVEINIEFKKGLIQQMFC